MIQTITKGDFRDAFHNMGRGDNFSYEGLGLLYDFFEEIDKSMELDVIAICCDFSEDSLEEVLDNYSIKTLEDLEDNTIVLKVNDETVVYQNY